MNWNRMTPPIEAEQGIVLPEGGFKLHPYRDSAGYPTIGAGSRTMPDGSPVTMSSPAITLAAAEAMYSHQLAHYCPVLAASIPQPLFTGQAAALMSMLHNCGPDCLMGSVIQKAIAAGDFPAALAQLGGWCVARNPETGVHEPSLGLMHRRAMDGLVWAGVQPEAAFQEAYGPHALTYAAGMALYRAAVAAATAWGYRGAPVPASSHPALTSSSRTPPAPRSAPASASDSVETDALNEASAAGTLSIP